MFERNYQLAHDQIIACSTETLIYIIFLTSSQRYLVILLTDLGTVVRKGVALIQG